MKATPTGHTLLATPTWTTVDIIKRMMSLTSTPGSTPGQGMPGMKARRTVGTAKRREMRKVLFHLWMEVEWSRSA